MLLLQWEGDELLQRHVPMTAVRNVVVGGLELCDGIAQDGDPRGVRPHHAPRLGHVQPRVMRENVKAARAGAQIPPGSSGPGTAPAVK